MSLNSLIMKKYYFLFFIWMIALTVFAQKMEMYEYSTGILNQEILSQRMVKDYMMKGINLNRNFAIEDLDETVSKYEEFRLLCEDAILPETINASMERSNELWMKFRLIIMDEVSKEGAFQLLKTNSSLLYAANNCFNLTKQSKSNDTLKGFYLSMQLQMLSERLASYYFMYAWGVKKEATLRYMNDATVEFNRLLNELTSLNNPLKVRGKLMSLKMDWKMAQKDIGNLGMGRVNSRHILDETNSLSKNLRLISEWYNDLESGTDFTANRIN